MLNLNKSDFLKKLFEEAVKAANPKIMMKKYFPSRPKGRTVVVGAGKGAAQMAKVLEELWSEFGYGALEGAVVTRYGYGIKTKCIEVLEASHPIPDENGLKASRRLMELVRGLGEDDLVIALICGGGSALLPAPLQGMTLVDEIAVNEALLVSGAPIGAMNTIRKHLSAIKGGRLAALAAPARVISFIVSDIPGDVVAQVASGPTVPDNTTRFDALALIRQYDVKLPLKVMHLLNSDQCEAPGADNIIFKRNKVHLVASASKSLEAAASYARNCGINSFILSDCIEGESKDIALMHAAIARNIALRDVPFQKPVIILSGGETSVTLKDVHGKGGRNTEFLLAFAIAIRGEKNIVAFAADTDGIDGSEDNAGALCDGNTFSRMRNKGCDPVDYLLHHDAWTAFHKVDSLFNSGPTGTNINDFRAIFVS